MVLISIIFTFLVSWTCIFTLPVELYGFYLLYTHLYEGRFHYSICKEYEERIKKKYDTNFSPLIIEVSKILQNKYLFYYLCLEDLIAALRFNIENSRIKKILNRGGNKYKKKSKKVLTSYGELYKDLYGCPFIFLSSFLTTLLVIKKDFYFQIQEKMNKKESLIINTYELEEYMRIALKIKTEKINLSYNENEKKYFFLEKFRNNLITDKNLHNYKNEKLNSLRNLSSISKKDLEIEEIIEILDKISLKNWNSIKQYKEFLIETIKNTPDKFILDYLSQNGFDLNEWIIPEYRHKIAHPVDFRPFKCEKNVYAMKIINRDSKPKVIQIQDFCDAVIKILSINNYMYESFFYNKFEIQNSEFKVLKIDLRKIHKAFESSSLSIH